MKYLAVLLFSVSASAAPLIQPQDVSRSTFPISISGNAASVTTDANLTGPVTSVGNATTIVGPIPSGTVDFSTITTALATKASTGTDNSMTRANALATFGAGQVTFVGTMTSIGNSFSVGGATFTVSGGSVTAAYQISAGSFLGVNGATETTNSSMSGVGTAASPLGVSPSSVAVLSAGLILNSEINKSSITAQGNVFNGASQLVQLDSNTKLPAVDGSQLLNLPSSSGGAVLASTQTFSGANTFSSSITVGPTTVSSTVTFASAVLGNWSLIASTHPVGVSSVYFYGLVSTSPYSNHLGSIKYRVEYSLKTNTNVGILESQFNGITGSNYIWTTWGFAEPSGGSLNNAGAPDSKCNLSYSAGEVVGAHVFGHFEFGPQPNNDILVTGGGQTAGFLSPGDHYGLNFYCGLTTGTSPLSSIKIFISAGTITGDVSIFALLVP